MFNSGLPERTHRRAFLQQAAGAGIGMGWVSAFGDPDPHAPEFRTANRRWQAAYDRALAVLAANVRVLPRYSQPVLIEGSNYAGIWLECGPQAGWPGRTFHSSESTSSLTPAPWCTGSSGPTLRVTRGRKTSHR